MTPDGITDADWGRIHGLAVEIVNGSLAEDQRSADRARTSLIELLDQFDEKYGPKPSLLATRADYVDSPVEREGLLRKAFSEAERIGDQKNRELIAHSLAQLFIEDVRDLEEGARWLGIWRDQVGVEPVDYDLAELARLETLLLK